VKSGLAALSLVPHARAPLRPPLPSALPPGALPSSRAALAPRGHARAASQAGAGASSRGSRMAGPRPGLRGLGCSLRGHQATTSVVRCAALSPHPAVQCV